MASRVLFQKGEIIDATYGKLGRHEVFSYPLPKAGGVDRRIEPNAGLSPKVAVLSISKDHSRRLLAPRPLEAPGVLRPLDRPRAVAVVFDWPALVEAATPWIDLAVEKINEENDTDEAQAAEIVDQVHTVLEVLKVLRTVTSETYVEGDVLVTHTLVEIRDVPE